MSQEIASMLDRLRERDHADRLAVRRGEIRRMARNLLASTAKQGKNQLFEVDQAIQCASRIFDAVAAADIPLPETKP